MQTKTENLHNLARELNLSGITSILDNLMMEAQQDQASYLDFALKLFNTEIDHRNNQNLLKRLKSAKLPAGNNLDTWQHNRQSGIAKPQLAQLRECTWLDQHFNVILMGSSGTGKTFIAAGLCLDAIKKGYKAMFRTMDQLVYVLKMKEITKSAAIEYNALLKANLVVIDDIMMFPVEKKQAVALFNLINHIHQNASMIVTTNKSPEEWAKMLDDEVLATAILDRILYNCEIVKLSGKSFRMDNRKTIFGKKSETKTNTFVKEKK
jgi:DNA replication protein DnaC